MRASLRLKLFLVLLVVSGLVVAVMFAVMQWSFERGFIGFVEAREQARVDAVVVRVVREYESTGGWQRLRGDRRLWVGLLLDRSLESGRRLPRWARRPAVGAPDRWPPDTRERRERDGDPARRQSRPTPLAQRLMLLDADRNIIFAREEDIDRLDLNPIESGGQVVGFLGVLPGPALNEIADIRFIEEQTRTFLLVAAFVVLLAGALALPIASAMSARIRRFTAATRALAAGRYETRVSAESSDELGALADDLNALAAALERTERNRREWVADASHELRTPLALLRAELEALQDGIRPLDAAAVDSLHADTMRLGRLVDDLYDLSRADLGALSYRMSPVDPVEILEDDLLAMRGDFSRQRIETRVVDKPNPPVQVLADPDRLSQLFRNLLTNTLRYTDVGGRLELEAECVGAHLAIELRDSAPGVPEHDIPRLFERFHRVEVSRSRRHGGSGLGLAICRSIVEAHQGTLQARPARLGGLAVRVELAVVQ